MAAQEQIKEEKILQIGKIYDDYFITATKFNYYIPKEIIEILYKMEGGHVLYKNVDNQMAYIIKEKR